MSFSSVAPTQMTGIFGEMTDAKRRRQATRAPVAEKKMTDTSVNQTRPRHRNNRAASQKPRPTATPPIKRATNCGRVVTLIAIGESGKVWGKD